MKAVEFNSGKLPNWCPGCGNFAIWNAIKGAFAELGINGKDIVNISGIGCSGKMLNYLRTYGFHTLHGRTMPVATGVKLANNRLTVLINGGDGDGYGMGMGHFVHAIRRNLDITYLVHNNHVYGLTTGQASPTTDRGLKSKSTPHGVIDEPLNGLLISLSAGATFVARGYSGDMEHLKNLIKEGINHKGFAHIEVLQPCVTFGKTYSYEYYDSKVYKLTEEYDRSNYADALRIIQEEDKLAIGVIYQTKKLTQEEMLPQISHTSLFEKGVNKRDITSIMDRMG
ncbi:MAG: 2-oxoacid:ferredoxin oxidoreductase subunit beta [Calditerrivibrio sp.]|nr:2-oxoacid:ferredoxin oxidoreductase subunit beta [Calditerrivibrio sp.]MCA1931970.1 2-oxoacid:ferredoxin oxidoreductase subunit beta [Calditerrivibrio sp.]